MLTGYSSLSAPSGPYFPDMYYSTCYKLKTGLGKLYYRNTKGR